MKELEPRMWPGRWSPEGYLREGDSLAAVLRADASTLARLGVEPRTIAERLQDLLERGSESEWRAVRVERWLVTIQRTRKMRACPWAESNIELCQVGAGAMKLSSNDFKIRRRGLKGSLRGTGLSVHLIRDHGFFCGPGMPYRIDPEVAVKILELA